MLRPMIVSGLTIDPLTNNPIVILKEIDGEKTLPIWIGLLEATATSLSRISLSISGEGITRIGPSSRYIAQYPFKGISGVVQGLFFLTL